MFKFIKILIQYLPVIIGTVKLVEGMTSADTDGEDKRELAVALILDALHAFGVQVSEALADFIGRLVDLVVRALNLLGIFKHADSEEPVAAEGGVASKERVAVVAQALRDQPVVNGHDYHDARLAELERLLTRE